MTVKSNQEKNVIRKLETNFFYENDPKIIK